MKIYRQGDVLIRQIKEIPKKSKKLNHRILAYGEATGHKHELITGDLYDADGVLFFSIAAETDLIHQEHEPITIPAGDYEAVRQKEYSPERIRYVRD